MENIKSCRHRNLLNVLGFRLCFSYLPNGQNLGKILVCNGCRQLDNF